MASNSYFSHDSNARNDQKLIRVRMKHGAAGYGVYFMLLERLKEEVDYSCSTDYVALAYDFHVDESLIKSVVENFDLFSMSEDGKRFYSQGFKDRMSVKDEARAALSETRRQAVNKRWHKEENEGAGDAENIQNDTSAIQNDTSAIQNDTSAIQNDTNKRKEKESKINISSSSEDDARKGADGRGGVFDFGILENIHIDIKNIKGITDDERSEAMRLCSWDYETKPDGSMDGPDEARKRLEYLNGWPTANKPFYIAIQTLQGLENRGQIKPPAREKWKIYCWIHEKFAKRDREAVMRLAKTADDIATLKECMMECTNPKKKIDNPGRYTIAALKQNRQ